MSQISDAVSRARRFHGRPPKKVRKLAIPDFAAVVCLGDASAIEYVSDKSVPQLGGKKKRLYRHKIGKGVKVYTDSSGKWLLVGGGDFHVTDWMRG